MLKRFFHLFQTIILISIFCFFTGCAGDINKARPTLEQRSSKSLIKTEIDKVKYEGSLWEENNPQSLLFYDTKARGINDIVVVNIIENVTGSSSANTDLNRETETKLKLSDFFGFFAPGTGIGIKGVNPNLIKSSASVPTIDSTTKNEYEGEGMTKREGSIIASISVTIVDVLENGNFFVEGKRDMKINNEEQYLYLKGVIRPQDISANNTIPSTLVADAQIELSGHGVVSEKQRPGWFTRVLDYLLPF